MIGIINYGLGNLGSVYNAFEFLKQDAEFVTDAAGLARADALVLPGVGHFGSGMKALEEMDIVGPLSEEVLEKGKPIIGICLGMQLMCGFSEEAGREGLNWFPHRVSRLKSKELKTPNMGWNEVVINGGRAFTGMTSPTFYFVHSYYVDGTAEHVSAYIDADVKVGASLERDNVFAMQFHPEKSQQDGLKVLQNFLEVVRGG